MTRGTAKEAGANIPEVHGVNKPLDLDLKPEKDKGLQKQVFTQPANVKPIEPVAVATEPAPPTPYLPRAMPQIKLPVKSNACNSINTTQNPCTNTSKDSNDSCNKLDLLICHLAHLQLFQEQYPDNPFSRHPLKEKMYHTPQENNCSLHSRNQFNHLYKLMT